MDHSIKQTALLKYLTLAILVVLIALLVSCIDGEEELDALTLEVSTWVDNSYDWNLRN